MRLAPILSRLAHSYEVDRIIEFFEFFLDKGIGLSTIVKLVTTVVCGADAEGRRI